MISYQARICNSLPLYQEGEWQQTEVLPRPVEGPGAVPDLRLQRYEVQLRLVQAVVSEVPDPAPLLLR